MENPDFQTLCLDAMEELERVKSENTRLERENHVLRVATRLTANISKKQEVPQPPVSVQTVLQVAIKTPEPTHFPPEILLVILRGALPPTWMLHGDRTSPESLNRYATQMKLSFLRVCKGWQDVGRELLYETIILHQIRQLPTFVRALEGREGLGNLVKHLDITFFTPRGYTTLLEDDTRRIFELCPRLARFGFAPTYFIPGLVPVLPSMASTITCLDYGDGIDMSVILPSLVQLQRTLCTLSLTFTTTLYDGFDLSFDNLDLSFDNLENLPLRLGGDHIFPHEPMIGTLVVYGPTLTFLEWDHGIQKLATISRSCPELQHLVLNIDPVRDGTFTIEDLTHDKIETLDVGQTWPTPNPRPTFNTLLEDSPKIFAALRNLRHLDSTFKCFWDLPVRVPPPPPAHDDATRALGSFSPERYPDIMDDVREFSDHKFVHGPLVPLWDDTDDYIPNEDGEDTTSLQGDGSSESSSDESESDSMSSSFRHELDDEFYMGDDWQIGHEEALRVLSKIQ
ncbi:hypothetical protein C8R46DRAFT_1240857 [Mycena filopes]|nr:hypothetical protein C8R46DRAFT_1240857 [Mycena filopes]